MCIRDSSKPLEIMFTENAVIIGIIAVNLPFMVLSLQSVIEGIARAVEEPAFSLGATPVANLLIQRRSARWHAYRTDRRHRPRRDRLLLSRPGRPACGRRHSIGMH